MSEIEDSIRAEATEVLLRDWPEMKIRAEMNSYRHYAFMFLCGSVPDEIMYDKKTLLFTVRYSVIKGSDTEDREFTIREADLFPKPKNIYKDWTVES